MKSEEIKIVRVLPTYLTRSHVKTDLLALLDRLKIRPVIQNLNGLRHFFVPKGKIAFFDCHLPDAEFTRLGFYSVVCYLIGDFGHIAGSGDDRRQLVEIANALVARIISPPIKNAGANFPTPRRRHHYHGNSIPQSIIFN